MELYKYLEELYLNNIPITLKSLVNTLYYSEEIIIFESNSYWFKDRDSDPCSIEKAYKSIIEDMEIYEVDFKLIFSYENARYSIYLAKEKGKQLDINVQVYITDLNKYENYYD